MASVRSNPSSRHGTANEQWPCAGPASMALASSAKGRHPGFADVAIAAIAKSRELVILTLNLRHFDHLGVETLNPLHAF
jgi:hypothetical protein